jgi:hypothetical protein
MPKLTALPRSLRLTLALLLLAAAAILAVAAARYPGLHHLAMHYWGGPARVLADGMYHHG